MLDAIYQGPAGGHRHEYLYDKMFPPKVIATLPNGKQVSKPRSRAPLAAAVLLVA